MELLWGLQVTGKKCRILQDLALDHVPCLRNDASKPCKTHSASGPQHRPDEVAVRSFGVARCAAKTCALCSLGFLVWKGVCRLLSWGCLCSLFYSPAPRPCFWVHSQKGQVWSWKNSREGALVVAYGCLELPPSAHLQEMQNCCKSACCLLGLSFLL